MTSRGLTSAVLPTTTYKHRHTHTYSHTEQSATRAVQAVSVLFMWYMLWSNVCDTLIWYNIKTFSFRQVHYQVSYWKGTNESLSTYSTKTALSSVHNDLVLSIHWQWQTVSPHSVGPQSSFQHCWPAHTSLDSILSNRFSVDGTALSWLKSYPTDHQSFTHTGRQIPSFPVDCIVRQGSVLGPRCFVSYTKDVTDLCWIDTPCGHTYTQVHDSCRPHSSLTHCTVDTRRWRLDPWCQSRWLQLNADKTEAVWFRSQLNLAKLNIMDCSVQVSSSKI